MLIIADSKIPHAEAVFAQFGEVTIVPTKQMTSPVIKNSEAIIIRSETKADAALLDGTNVHFVGTATIGTDHVDLEYLKERGIAFASCPGSNANSVAEYILAALFEVSARLGFLLKGKTLGVVGHGNTGSRVAQKAEAIGMKTLLNDPPLARATGDRQYLPLDELMSADFISLHVPLTNAGEDATFHLFDGRRLSAMKEGSILINSSRGAVVDNAALKTILHKKHLRACVLDVWEGEPKIDAELLRLVTFGTPHIAGYSYDGKLNATKMLQQALCTFVQRPIIAGHQIEETEQKAIFIPGQSGSPESLLRCAVRNCYSLEQDDERLRKVLTLDEHSRGDYFRELRATYPTRREFYHYVIGGNGLDPQVMRTLSSIGFMLPS